MVHSVYILTKLDEVHISLLISCVKCHAKTSTHYWNINKS